MDRAHDSDVFRADQGDMDSEASSRRHQRPAFEFIPGPAPELLTVAYSGFWDEKIWEQYIAALQNRSESWNGRSPVRRVLLDMRLSVIQGKDLMERFRTLLGSYSGQVEHYGVLLPRSPLLVIQIRRIMDGFPARYFENQEEAALWLAS